MGLGRRSTKSTVHHRTAAPSSTAQSSAAGGGTHQAAGAQVGHNAAQQGARAAAQQAGDGGKVVKQVTLTGEPVPPSNADPCAFLERSPHPRLPELPEHQGELFYECTLFLYSVAALMVQYMNLYKTAWWLPHAHVHNAVKFWMIDPYLVSCVGLILGRRVTLCFLHRLSIIPWDCDPSDVPGILRIVDAVLKTPMYTAVLSSFLFSFLRVVQTYPMAALVHLFYPVLVYLFLFYYDLLWPWGRSSRHTGGKWTVSKRHARSENYPDGLIDAEIVKHRCGIGGAPWARIEADVLLADLAYRCRLSLFSAFAVAYFAVYIPTVFAPPSLAIDRYWSGQLTCIVFLSSLTLYFTYMFPLHYCDLIHRCAWHLGSWERISPALARQLAAHVGDGSRQPDEAFVTWNEHTTYERMPNVTGILVVQHEGRTYRAVGTRIAAIPGFSDHYNFYRLAHDPLRLPNALCFLAGSVIAAEFAILMHSSEWNHILTLLLLMFINYGLLFKLFKDKVILGRIYGSFVGVSS